MHAARHGGGAQSLQALPACATLPVPWCVHQPRSSQTSSFRFFGGSLHRHDWFHHWPLVSKSLSRLSPLLRGPGIEQKVPLLYPRGWFLWQGAPLLQEVSLVWSQVWKEDYYEKQKLPSRLCHSGNHKSFGSSVPGTGDKDQTYISSYYSKEGPEV